MADDPELPSRGIGTAHFDRWSRVLRGIVKRAGISAADLARLSGLRHQRVQAMLGGMRDYSVIELEQVLAALSVSVDDFLVELRRPVTRARRTTGSFRRSGSAPTLPESK